MSPQPLTRYISFFLVLGSLGILSSSLACQKKKKSTSTECPQGTECSSGLPSVSTPAPSNSDPAPSNSDPTPSTPDPEPPLLTDITAAQQYEIYVAISPLQFNNTGEDATSCEATPPLPAGLEIKVHQGSCEISGTPTTTSNATLYTIRATTAHNLSATAQVTIGVIYQPDLICPPGYIPVPRYIDDHFDVAPFCVMKYEAKDVGGVATSQPALASWIHVPRGLDPTTPGGAWKKCRDLGPGYDLITNDQWQSLARQIERATHPDDPTLYLNWQNGSPAGGNSINRGHATTGVILAADPDDTNGCYGTHATIDCGQTWQLYKRTHTLPNGEVIWDLAGNAWEWVQEDSNGKHGSDAYISALTLTSHTIEGPLGRAREAFGPYGDYSTTKTSVPYGGLGKAWLNYTAGTIVRGGSFGGYENTGIFAVHLDSSLSETYNDQGFRCTYTP